MEKKYLVCLGCGEAFDSIETASTHPNHQYDDQPAEFTILPESEAM